MSISGPPQFPDFDTMTPADFERYLPDFFAASDSGKVSADPRLRRFLDNHPDCAALVSDLESIAQAARDIFNTTVEPTDKLWGRISDQLTSESVIHSPANSGKNSI